VQAAAVYNEAQMRRIEVEILKGHPGSGKTFKIFEDFKKFKGRCLYLSFSHHTLKEKSIELTKAGVSHRHIYGLASKIGGCPCLERNEEGIPKSVLIDRLVRHFFSNKTVCNADKKNKIMEKLGIKECRYKKQFIGIKKCHVVLAPIQCLYAPNLLEKYQPDFIVIDDCLDAINPEPKIYELFGQLQYLAGLARIEFSKEEEACRKKDTNPLETFSKRADLDIVFPKLEEAFGRQLRKLIKQVQKGDSSTYHTTFLIPLELLQSYLEKAKKYGFEHIRFARPAYFYMFDYSVQQQIEKNRKIKMVLVDAEPPYEILAEEAKRYFIETRVTVEFKDVEFKAEVVNRGSVAFKIGNPMQWFPKESLKQQHVQDSIKEWFELLMEHFFDNDLRTEIGVITLKPRMPENISETEKLRRLNIHVRRFVPEQYKVHQPPAVYWNIKSQNDLEHCDVLALIGTPITNKSDLELTCSDWFPHIIFDKKDFEVNEKRPHGRWYTFPNKYVEMLRYRMENYELYQAQNRIRPTLRQKIILLFSCALEEKLRKDKIKVVNIMHKKDLEKRVKRTQKLIDFVVAHGGKMFRGDAEQMFVDQFGISKNWAYRAVMKVIRKTDELKYENGWIVYESKNC
jgi:hypothetical protein